MLCPFYVGRFFTYNFIDTCTTNARLSASKPRRAFHFSVQCCSVYNFSRQARIACRTVMLWHCSWLITMIANNYYGNCKLQYKVIGNPSIPPWPLVDRSGGAREPSQGVDRADFTNGCGYFPDKNTPSVYIKKNKNGYVRINRLKLLMGMSDRDYYNNKK